MAKLARGFTLIEVLIAVIVLSIALLAITRNAGLVVHETSELQQRTIAHWVAMDIMAQAQLGLISVNNAGDSQNGTETQLNHDWDWQLTSEAVPNENNDNESVIKIIVNVQDSVSHEQLATVFGYILLWKHNNVATN